MTSSNPNSPTNSPTNSPLNFRPFALGKRGQKFRLMPANDDGITCAATAEPDQATGLAAVANGQTTIELEWSSDNTAPPNQASSYDIERSDNGTSGWSVIGSSTGRSFSDTSLSAGTKRWYRLIAKNCFGSAAPSATAEATTAAASISPSWSLDFSSGSFSGATLTRASTGTYVNSSGYVASASTDVARLTHNSSGSRLGLLVEGQRTNILANSANMGALAVSGATITSDTDTSPDNTTSADKLTETSGTNVHAIRSGTLTASDQTYTASGYLKNPASGGRGYGFIGLLATGGVDTAYCAVVNLTNGTFETSFSAGSPSASYTITDAGNGWYRVSVTATAPSGTTLVRWRAGMWRSGSVGGVGSNTGQPQYNVPSGSEQSILVWGAQVEAASTVSSYIPTTTASVTRSADLVHVLDSSITNWGDPGALVVHFYPPGQAGTLISTDDASTAQVGIEASTTTAARAFWSSGSTATGTIGSGVQKAVHYWNGSTSKFCINGGTVQSGTNNLTIGNTDFVTLGAEATDSAGVPGTFSQYANCVIRKVEFYSGTLTDSNLQTITT